MPYNFQDQAGKSSNFDVIPAGYKLWVWTNLRGLKVKDSQYLDFEFTVDDGQPYARRKWWEKVGDPNYEPNSEKWKEMGALAITRMMESGRDAGPSNPQGYFCSEDYHELDGIRIAVQVGVEPEQNGWPEKNRVAEFLTPNPASKSGYKGYVALVAGQHEPSSSRQAPPAANGGFGAAQPALPVQPKTGGFGAAVSLPAAQPENPLQPTKVAEQIQPAATGWGAQSGVKPAGRDINQKPSWMTQAKG